MFTAFSARQRHATASPGRRGKTRGIRYLVTLAATMLVCIAAGFTGLRVLDAAGHLPPPPVNKWLCFDEKAHFLKLRGEKDPTFLSVGSSVTWRNVDLGALERALGPGERMLNGAPCFLYVNQTFFLTRYYLERFPHVRSVMTVLAIRDFEKCQKTASAFFDPRILDGYLDGTIPADLLYFKNFRPASFFRDIRHIRSMRDGSDVHNTLAMDRYGSGPIQVPREEVRGVFYGAFSVDPDCMTALADMANYLAERDIRFIVVLMPMMPAWSEQYDPDGAIIDNFAGRVARTLETTTRPDSVVLIDGTSRFPMNDADYTDAIHLQWKSVSKFMNYISRDIQQMQAKGALNLNLRNSKS